MLASAAETRASTGQIRLFNPARDLAPLAALIEVAFAEELLITGSTIVRDLRQMATLGPMLWAADSVGSIFTGFVWYENGNLVGNVSLDQHPRSPGVWVISNVAVLPDFRGQGIASHLLDMAIEQVRRRHGQRILLQVRAGNETAIGLYRRRGFVTYDSVHELGLRPSEWPLLIGPARVPLRPARVRDRGDIHRLALASTPHSVLTRNPGAVAHLRPGFWLELRRALGDVLGGRQRCELVGERDRSPAAYGSLISVSPVGSYELEMYVPHRERGNWELGLMEELLRRAAPVHRALLRAYFSSSFPEAIQSARTLGMHLMRVLDQMSLELMGPSNDSSR